MLLFLFIICLLFMCGVGNWISKGEASQFEKETLEQIKQIKRTN